MTLKTKHWIISAAAGLLAGVCLSRWLHDGSDAMIIVAVINFGLSWFNAARALKQ